jgi:hypothetical protein
VLRWHSPLSARANFAHFQGPLDASRSPGPSESSNDGGSETEGCEILTTKPTLLGFSSAMLFTSDDETGDGEHLEFELTFDFDEAGLLLFAPFFPPG